jgi:hypothetical protein
VSHAVDDGLLSTADGQVAASITSLRNQWQQYLNHKEQMAYVAAIVYIGSAATVATRQDLASQLHTPVGELSAILIAIAAFVFVTWQVDRLRVATHTLAVCNELLLGIHSQRSPTPTASRLALAFEGTSGVFPHHALYVELVAILVMIIFSVFAGLAIWRV